MADDFRSLGVKSPILDVLEGEGFTTPTEIQAKAIPPALEGRDVVGIAPTGTGKTLAYLIPILQDLEPGSPDPQALVLCPTRELALQVYGEAERVGRPLGARAGVVYGGTGQGEQKQLLKEGCDVLVATPGRALDFLQSAWLSLRRLRYFVLDEADRMLDMGFIRDVDAILGKAPLSRRTFLFSATLPPEVQRLAERYMNRPVVVELRHAGSRVKDSVRHFLLPVREADKLPALLEIFRRERPDKALVFTATREATSATALKLREAGWEAVSISSLLSQANRERALGAFRKGEFDVLVATDVAARGLDIQDIDLVVNFDVPSHTETYVHRIGRTGRAASSGLAVTLATPEETRKVRAIEAYLGERIPVMSLEGFAAPRRRSAGKGESGRGSRPARGRARPRRRGGRGSRGGSAAGGAGA